MSPQIISASQTLWNYHLMNHKMQKSDCILVLGSHDLRVATRGAELYLHGYAPLLVMSGGLGNFTKNIWTESEADKFAMVAIEMGVPQKDILIENRSSNTGENILFSKRLLEENHCTPQKIILVQKPYMERRSYATIRKQWPEPEVLVTSPKISFEDYPNDEIPIERVINIMVGDLQRILEYPSKGFQIVQEVPQEVIKAYQFLIHEGFDKHLSK